MTFAALRSLYALIGEALDDVERIYRDASHESPTPTTPYALLTSPCTPYHRRGSRDDGQPEEECPPYSAAHSPKTPRRGLGPHGSFLNVGADTELDFPALDTAYYPTEKHDAEVDAAESLASHPDVIAATNRIVAACGQMSATVHRPFLTLCDAAMGYHLPACLRFLEASHTVELLRAAGPNGMHVRDLSQHVHVDESKLGHILRLLATHHITREIRPNVFANNRISAIMDSGRSPEDLKRAPQDKYENTNGIAAFVNLCTDELFKSAGYLADCYLPTLSGKSADKVHAMHAPFNLAFGTETPYFEWLERPGNEARLKRFGPAMTGTAAWEVPGAVIVGFPWHELRDDSLVVDVGGGIGSTAMLLAHTFPHLKFVIQDRPQVAEQGVAAWRERCPEILDSGRAMFLGHDFFLPQPPLMLSGENEPTIPSVYILRVVTHDWPDTFVTKILLNLRLAAGPHTRLLIADHILPHACIDESEDFSPNGERFQGMVRSLAPEGSPLLPNLGKANANAYWLDLTMRVAFNAQERTLREMAALTLSAGWMIVDVVHGEESSFGHITAVPVEIPAASLALLDSPDPATPVKQSADSSGRGRSGSILSTPESVRMGRTFGTLTTLPTEDTIRKPARKSRRSLIPWWRTKPAPDARQESGGKAVTPENQDDASKPSKTRRPKLSILTSTPPVLDDRPAEKVRHKKSSSVVRILSQHANKSSVCLNDEPTEPVRPREDGLALNSFVPFPPSETSGLLPALEPAPPVKLKSMPSRTSLRKKASQVFEFSKASVANLRSVAMGGSGGGANGIGNLGAAAASTTRLPGVEEGAGMSVGESMGGKVEGRRMRSKSQLHIGPAHVSVEMRQRKTARSQSGGKSESGEQGLNGR